MKILFQGRPNLFESPGGDKTQIMQTKEHIAALGHEVELSCELCPDVKEFDLVHIFNHHYVEEVYAQVVNAKRHKKPVALSTIYMNYSFFDKEARGGIIGLLTKSLSWKKTEYLKGLYRFISQRKIDYYRWLFINRGYYSLLGKVIEKSDILLPNSHSEYTRLCKDFKVKNKLYKIVPNAVDEKMLQQEDDASADDKLKAYKNCVLSVARIENRKCQLQLVRALKNTPYTLVLIGHVPPGSSEYFTKIKNEMGPNQHYLGFIKHKNLAVFYKLAKVHCLVSWMETTGLSSLEAGFMGCNLVVTEYGDAKDYFKNYAYYCEPNSVASIRSAVDMAYNDPANPNLKNFILENYTWRITAQKTVEAYGEIIDIENAKSKNR
jgi:glycosyltransferase involved in cell wall biosynthesis